MEGREEGKREEDGQGREEVGKEGKRREIRKGEGKGEESTPAAVPGSSLRKACTWFCYCHVRLLKTYF